MSQVPYTLPASAHPALWKDLKRLSNTAKPESKWHAVYTLPRHEKSLARQLCLRGIDHFLPLYSAKRKWSDGSKVTLELPLFPGYIFVSVEPESRVRVLQCPGALYMLQGMGKEPAEIAGDEIERLRSGLIKDRSQPHPLLTVGQRARIVRGPLAGMQGILQRFKGGFRVVLTLELIKQSVAVEIEMGDLELPTN